MQINELKNYGVEMNLMFQKIPNQHPDTVKTAKKTAMGIIQKRIGVFKMPVLFLLILQQKKRIDKISFPVSTQMEQQTVDMLKKSFSGKGAMYCALEKLTDKDAAMEVLKEIADKTAYETAMTELPSPKEFASCGDAFLAFKEYILEMFRASKKAGIHDYRVRADTEDCLEFDITYCAIYEYMKKIAPKEACMANCYGDDILFPKLCPKLGASFKREGNMACGYHCCNTRYEREGKKHEE